MTRSLVPAGRHGCSIPRQTGRGQAPGNGATMLSQSPVPRFWPSGIPSQLFIRHEIANDPDRFPAEARRVLLEFKSLAREARERISDHSLSDEEKKAANTFLLAGDNEGTHVCISEIYAAHPAIDTP